jgi:hypothetical protein
VRTFCIRVKRLVFPASIVVFIRDAPGPDRDLTIALVILKSKVSDDFSAVLVPGGSRDFAKRLCDLPRTRK